MRFKSFAAALILVLSAGPAFAQQPPTTIVKPGKHIDSLWNGALIGAGVGAVGAWIFTRANCGPAGYDDECTYIAAPVGVVIFVPAGAIGGAIIDRLINMTLPVGAKSHTSIAPILSRQGGRTKSGVMLNLKIGF